MIPKIIHYCWFSDEKPNRLIRNCMDTWQKVLPDYTIKHWDIHSFDFDSVPFTREALSLKRYSYVSDYIRLYALYNDGGIYLDADVKVYRDFSPLLSLGFFSGTEAFLVNNQPHYRIEAAIMGAEAHHTFVKQCLDYYSQQHFIKEDGTLNLDISPDIISKIARESYGYKYINQLQELDDTIAIYPTSYFTNTLIPDYSTPQLLYAQHCNAATWRDFNERGKFFHFCHKHDLMKFYHLIEKIKP